MKVMITGGKGRLGSRLADEFRARGFDVAAPPRSEVDWSSAVESARAISECKPAIIIGCAAYTSVARAEVEVGRCHADTYGTAISTARAASQYGIPFIYVSTDYVVPLLNGERGGVYAVCKLRAENAVIRNGGRIVRIAFMASEQSNEWEWVNSYSVANRWWVEDAVTAIADASCTLDDFGDSPIRELGPAKSVTPAEMLEERFPSHPALLRRISTPDEMRKLVGFAAPRDSRFNRRPV